MIENALNHFRFQLNHILKQTSLKPRYNLSKIQRQMVRQLKGKDNIIILDADKNLGVTLMERNTYIMAILQEHLYQPDIYTCLSPTAANNKLSRVENDAKNLVLRPNPELTKEDKRFMCPHCIPTFYELPKLNKNKTDGFYKIRPAVVKVWSFIGIASKFYNFRLFKLIPCADSYLKDSFALLKDLPELPKLPTSVRLITADAVPMYTNIDTQHGLQILQELIFTYAPTIDPTFLTDTIFQLLKIMMKNNVFTFGDLFFLRKCRTAMGTIASVKYTSIYFDSHENNTILPKYKHQFLYYRRCINNVFIIWRPDPFSWENLQRDSAFDRITWEVNKSFKTIKKSLYLHNYLPLSSAHPPGTFKNMVVGFIQRYWLMNSQRLDFIKQICEFAERLQKRGYSRS